MRADGNGNGQRLFLLQRALGEFSQVIGRYDVDTGNIFLVEHHPIDASVHAEFRIFGDNYSRRNHGTTVHHREDRDRQVIEIHFVLGENDVFNRRSVDAFRFDGMVHRRAQLFLDFFVGCIHS